MTACCDTAVDDGGGDCENRRRAGSAGRARGRRRRRLRNARRALRRLRSPVKTTCEDDGAGWVQRRSSRRPSSLAIGARGSRARAPGEHVASSATRRRARFAKRQPQDGDRQRRRPAPGRRRSNGAGCRRGSVAASGAPAGAVAPPCEPAPASCREPERRGSPSPREPEPEPEPEPERRASRGAGGPRGRPGRRQALAVAQRVHRGPSGCRPDDPPIRHSARDAVLRVKNYRHRSQPPANGAARDKALSARRAAARRARALASLRWRRTLTPAVSPTSARRVWL